MQQQLINLNPDLKRLADEGYDLEVINGGRLLVHHIPYVTSTKAVKYGTIVCLMPMPTTTTIGAPTDHTVHFCGEKPCDSEGNELTALINNSNGEDLTPTLHVDHYFSSKPASGRYKDHYEKIRTYSEILASQARAIDSFATSKPNRKKAA